MVLRRALGLPALLFFVLVVSVGCQINYSYSDSAGYGQPQIDVTPLPGLPATAKLVSFSFADSQHGWAAATNCPKDAKSACRGVLFRTVDGGRHWVSTLPTLLTPRKLQFADAVNGWFIGSIGQHCGSQVCPNEIMMSTDGGKTWTRASSVNVELLDLGVVSPSDVWVLGRLCTAPGSCRAALATTTSAGQLWANQNLPVYGETFALERLDAQAAWVMALAGQSASTPPARPRLALTVDRGTTWQTASTPCAGREQAFDFRSKSAGWVLCGTPSGVQLYATNDGARTWQAAGLIEAPGASSAARTPVVVGLTRFSDLAGAVALDDGTGGTIEVTQDGGTSWKVALQVDEPLTSLEHARDGDFRALGSRHVYVSTDSGRTWATQGLEYHPSA